MSAAKVILTGRISNDPKEFANEDGTKLRLLFNVACNVKGKDYERVDFHPCIMWGDERVKSIKPWLTKGRLVEIYGHLRTYDKRDEDDKFVSKHTEIVVQTLEFLDRKPEGVDTPPQEEEKKPAANMEQMLALMQQMMQGMAK